jgi:hypothetical protein
LLDYFASLDRSETVSGENMFPLQSPVALLEHAEQPEDGNRDGNGKGYSR